MFQKTVSIQHSETRNHAMLWLANSYWVSLVFNLLNNFANYRKAAGGIFLHRGRCFFHVLMRKQDSHSNVADASACPLWTLMRKATRIKWFLWTTWSSSWKRNTFLHPHLWWGQRYWSDHGREWMAAHRLLWAQLMQASATRVHVI